MRDKLKKLWSILSTALVVFIVLCAVFLVGSRLLGYQVYTVLSGSMRPAYAEGDLLYVEPVKPSQVKVDDPITFVLNEKLTVATHRVVRIDGEKQLFYTKGDANGTEDTDPVHFNNLIGIPRFSVPLLGYVSYFVQNPPGTYITLVAGLLLIGAVFLPDLLPKKKEKQETEE